MAVKHARHAAGGINACRMYRADAGGTADCKVRNGMGLNVTKFEKRALVFNVVTLPSLTISEAKAMFSASRSTSATWRAAASSGTTEVNGRSSWTRRSMESLIVSGSSKIPPFDRWGPEVVLRELR